MYDVEHCVIKPAQMSPDKLEEGLEWAWKETYKMRSILDRIVGFDSLFFFNLPLNLGYKLYAKKLSRFTKTIMTDNSDIPI